MVRAAKGKVVTHEFDKPEVTERLGKDIVEPKAELPPLPPDGDAPGIQQQRNIEAASKELRHRAHRYHGVTRADPPKGQHDIDAAASALYRAAIRFTHAYDPSGAKIDPTAPERGCACIYCA